jgi:hypothetical protein
MCDHELCICRELGIGHARGYFISLSFIKSLTCPTRTVLALKGTPAQSFDSWRELQMATTPMPAHWGRPVVLSPGVEPGASGRPTEILSIKLREQCGKDTTWLKVCHEPCT